MISREQVINRLLAKDLNFYHKKQCPRADLYRQRGTGVRVAVPRYDIIEDRAVRSILRQAGLADGKINDFILGAGKR